MRPLDYEILCDLPEGEYDGRNIKGVRTVTYRVGANLEVMCYPIVPIAPEAKRELKRRKTGEAMREVNQRNRIRHMTRIHEANFTPEAFFLTFTYPYPFEEPGLVNIDDLIEEYDRMELPWEYADVKRDYDNYARRVKRLMVKRGHKANELKWSRVIEEHKKQPMPGLPHHLHIHALIEAPGVTRDELEAMWEKGKVTRCRRFDKADDGARRIADYMSKNGRDASEGGPAGGRRWWSHSRNLKIPRPTVSDRKISRRALRELAMGVLADARAIFARKYADYRLVEHSVRFSDFVPGAYIYARMRRRD